LIEPAIATRIAPDYLLSVPEVYMDFAKKVIISTDSLYVISTNNPNLSAPRALPSWVPDLGLSGGFDERNGNVWDKNAFRASGKSSTDVKSEGTYLSARGFQADVVDGLGVTRKHKGCHMPVRQAVR
jgi:hypothetical protein